MHRCTFHALYTVTYWVFLPSRINHLSFLSVQLSLIEQNNWSLPKQASKNTTERYTVQNSDFFFYSSACICDFFLFENNHILTEQIQERMAKPSVNRPSGIVPWSGANLGENSQTGSLWEANSNSLFSVGLVKGLLRRKIERTIYLVNKCSQA